MIAGIDLAAATAFLDTTLRIATPILLASLGVLISDRAGVFNVGVEGMMLIGAFAGVIGSAYTGNVWLGLCCALVSGAGTGGLLAFACRVLKTDIILAGVAMNLGAASGTTLLLFMITGQRGISDSLHSGVLPDVHLGPLEAVPVLGPLLSGQHVLTYLAFAAVPVVAFLLNQTVVGLRMRASGENAAAVVAAGIDVGRIQLYALMISGVCAAAGGAFLSMGYVSWFAQDMTAGRGFIAIAAELMGRSTPSITLLSALLLAASDAAAIDLQRFGFPSELMQAVPYVVPVAALAIYGRRYLRLRSIR